MPTPTAAGDSMSTATERVWAALEALTDPEIPVVTLREQIGRASCRERV